jgi:hypothetical protein
MAHLPELYNGREGVFASDAAAVKLLYTARETKEKAEAFVGRTAAARPRREQRPDTGGRGSDVLRLQSLDIVSKLHVRVKVA